MNEGAFFNHPCVLKLQKEDLNNLQDSFDNFWTTLSVTSMEKRHLQNFVKVLNVFEKWKVDPHLNNTVYASIIQLQ